MKVIWSCLTLCHPMDYTVHGTLQVKILEWVAFPFSRGSSQPRDWTQVSCIAGGFFTNWAMREAQVLEWVAYPFSSGSSLPRNRTRVSCIGDSLPTELSEKPKRMCRKKKKKLLCFYYSKSPLLLFYNISALVITSLYIFVIIIFFH